MIHYIFRDRQRSSGRFVKKSVHQKLDTISKRNISRWEEHRKSIENVEPSGDVLLNVTNQSLPANDADIADRYASESDLTETDHSGPDITEN